LKDEVTIGIVGVQGDIEENIAATKEALKRMKVSGAVEPVRYSGEIEEVGSLSLPGG